MPTKGKIRIVIVGLILISVLLFLIIRLKTNTSSHTTKIAETKNISNQTQTIPDELAKKTKKPDTNQSPQKKLVSKEQLNPVFVDNSEPDVAGEIVLNSGDEPGRVEAPEIHLDKNDTPILDEKGNPLLK